MNLTINDLVEVHNRLNPRDRISTWKRSKAELEKRIVSSKGDKVGTLACDLIRETDLTNVQIVELIRGMIPEAKTTNKSVAFYRHAIKKAA